MLQDGFKTRKKLEPAGRDNVQRTARSVRLQRAELRQARQQISALNAVAAILGESRDLNTILQSVIEKITEIFRFDVTRIYLYDAHRDKLVLKASFSTHPETRFGRKSFKLGQGILGKVAETGEAIAFEDIQHNTEYLSLSRTRRLRKEGYRFFGTFPIRTKLRTVGTIVCIGSKARRLQSSERQLIVSIANQIGVAFDNVALIEDARAKADELSALYSISTIINQSLDLDFVLRKVMYRVMEIFGADAARIYLLDEEENELRLIAHEGLPDEFTLPDRYKPGQGLTGKVFESGTPLFFGNVRKSRKFARMASAQIGLKEIYRKQFYIPISIKSKTVGVMNFLTKTPRPFTSTETQLISTIANHLGIAFENLSLFRKFAKQSQELTALVKINRDIASLLDRNALLPRIAQEAKRVLKVDIANFRLLQGDELVFVGTSHAAFSRFRPKLRLGESLTGIVVSEKRVVAVRNVRLDPRVLETHGDLYRKMGWRSYLGIPMVIGNRVLGVLCFVSKKERDFSPQEIHVIKSFADQAAIAVENANLFGEITDKVAALERLNRELHEANRIKSDFVAAVSHELRTPLSTIIGYTSLLQDGYGGRVNATQEKVLEAVGHSAQTLLNLINNVLTLARVEAKKMPLEISRAPLEDTLYHVRMYTEHMNQGNGVKVSWHVEKNLPSVLTDHGKLEEILQNLIGNAYKFTPQGRITIRVRNLRDTGRIDFAVSDTGVGIEKVNLERAFDKFHQGPQAHLGAHGGMGLGLSIVKEFLHLIKGEMHVESRPGVGSTFAFTLPYSIHP